MTGSRDPVQPEGLLQVVYAWAGRLSSELFWATDCWKTHRSPSRGSGRTEGTLKRIRKSSRMRLVETRTDSLRTVWRS